MPRIPGLRRVFRLDAPLRRVEQDVDEELAFHFESKVAELMAGGRTPEQARAEAERRFGDVRHYRAELRDIDHERAAVGRRADLLEATVHDLRHAARGLRRQPGFTLAVVLTFALGIGANATMFGIVDRLVLRPPPHVVAPERLYGVALQSVRAGDTLTADGLAYAMLEDLRAGVGTFSSVAAYTGLTFSLGRGAEAQRVDGSIVTGGFFPQLGVRPAVGRLLSPADDAPGAPLVAVLDHGFWQRAFAGDPSVVGRTVRIDRSSYTIVGVTPPGFRGLGRTAPDLWLPLVPTVVARGDQDALTGYGWQWLRLVGRLRPGATVEQATAQVAATLLGVADRDESLRTGATPVLRSVLPRAALAESADVRVALLLGAVSLLVLLIACANVANLLLARALRRRRETAVRLALGVSRRRLAAHFLSESLLLALLGGMAALLVVHVGGGLVAPLLLGADVAAGAADRRVLAFTALATLAAGLLAGIVPALQASRPSLGGMLRQDARGGGRHGRTRAALLLTQAALSVVLLVGTGLFVRSLLRVNAERLGYDVRQVVVGTMGLRTAGYDDVRAAALFDAMAERARALPGVQSAAVAAALPLSMSYGVTFRIPGRDSLPRVPDGGPYLNAVSHDFMTTVGLRLLRGRGFTAADRAGAQRVVVVNQAMAELYWPGEDPIGECVHIGADSLPCATIVGVAENARRQSIVENVSLQYLVPLDQSPMPPLSRTLFVRPAGGADPRVVSAEVRRTMQGMAADLPYANVRMMAELLTEQMRPWRMGAALFAAFGVLALVLAAVGLYGVIAYSVSQRTHELGVRIALGARAGDVRRMVLRQGVGLAAAGALVGAGVAAAAAPRVGDLLFKTSPRDPVVFGGVVAVLLLVSVAATLVPAWRASRVDPAVALRAD